MVNTFTSYRIEERSYVSLLKREIHSKALVAKFGEKQLGEIDIIVAEITSNLIKHASNGEILYRIQHSDGHDPEFEIICIDRGPGMEDTARMMKDGMSTTKTLGQGLGAIDRLSSFFQMYSIPKWGTVVYAKVGNVMRRSVNKGSFGLELKTLFVNKPKEVVCGDGYRVKETSHAIKIFFGDGLGHGEFAKEAVDAAGSFFLEVEDNDPVAIIRQMHEKVRRTRGLVASIAIFEKNTNQWKICGVGNILSRMYNGIEYKNYMSYNGAIGLNIPNTMNASVFSVDRNQHLIMCSDGIQSRWDLTRYPSIFKYDNTVLAAILYKDFGRGTDDTSSLIAKVI